ncbi:MAG: ribosome assembly cofactor RimP [Muribaculaceae bacterium]|nr:ribosome assembly cofactor RimP [Muribaculaceae bacterium]
MIDKELLRSTVARSISGTDLFIVDITVSPANDIVVGLDSATGVDIDICASITRDIEQVFDRDTEDYSLEVGSVGITSDFKVRGQYDKNIGNDLEILTRDGRKLRGVLTAVAQGEPTDSDVDFTVEITSKVKEPGAKRPVMRTEALELKSADCKYVLYDLKF